MPYLKGRQAASTAALLMAGLVGAYASAEINLNDSTVSRPAAYAAETLTTAAKDFTALTATATTFSVTGTLGAGLPTNQGYYFRIDLEPTDAAGDRAAIRLGRNLSVIPGPAEDFSLLTPQGVHGQPGDLSIVYGGAAGSDFAVIQMQANNTGVIPKETTLTLNLDASSDNPGLEVRGALGDASYGYKVVIRVYDDYSEAIRASNETFGQDIFTLSADLVRVEKALTVTVKDPKTITADVATGYAQFLPGTKPSATDGGLSSVDVAFKTSYDHDGSATTTALPLWAANDGETVALGDLLKSASVDFNGNFSVGAFHMGTTSAVLLDEFGKTIEKTGDGGKSYADADRGAAGFARITTTGAGGTFAANVKDNTARIPEGSYTASVAVTLANENADASMHKLAGPLPAGTIIRNGTTAHVGYVTAASVYNQRLVLVNHGLRDADFRIHSLTVEPGNAGAVMLGEGAPDGLEMVDGKATGAIAKGQTLVLRMRDIVSFTGEGSPRGALTVDVDAHGPDVSIATTQVNIEDGSADTVRYHPQ